MIVIHEHRIILFEKWEVPIINDDTWQWMHQYRWIWYDDINSWEEATISQIRMNRFIYNYKKDWN